MLGNLSIKTLLNAVSFQPSLIKREHTYLKSIRYDLVIPCPCSDFTEKVFESLQTNPRLRFFFMTLSSREKTRRRNYSRRRWHNAHGSVKGVVDETSLFLVKSAKTPKIPNSTSFSERFNAVNDLAPKPLAFWKNCIISDDGEFPKRDKEKLLEVGYCTCSRVWRVWVCRFLQRCKVIPHQTIQ